MPYSPFFVCMIWEELPFELEIKRDDLSLGGVYILTTDTGHYYIGSTRNFGIRIKCHKTSFRKGYPDNKQLRFAADSCKKMEFSVLEIVKDHSLLKNREDFYLSSRWGDPLLLNRTKPVIENSKWNPEKVGRYRKPTKGGRLIYFKKVINTVTGEIFNSTKDISAMTGLPPRYYNRRLNGERKNNTPYQYIEGERHAVYKSKGTCK